MKNCIPKLFLLIITLMYVHIIQAQPTAKIQAVHNMADPALDTIDVYIAGNLLINDFVFHTATPMLDVPAGFVLDVGVAPSNSTSVNDTLINFPVLLDSNHVYAAIASGVGNPGIFAPNPDGKYTGISLFMLDNLHLSAQTSGYTDFVILHNTTDAGTADVRVRNMVTLADNLVYGDASSYDSLQSLTYVVDVTDSAQSTIYGTFTADLSSYPDSAMVIFTSGFIDTSANQGGPVFGLFGVFPDGNIIEFPQVSIAYLQAVHNCADPAADSLDIYALGFLAVDNFLFRTATAYLAVPAGIPLDVGVAPGNSTGVADTIRNFPVILENGKNYIAFASGVIDTTNFASNPDGKNISFNLLNADYAKVLADNASNVDILFVHGVTDGQTVDVMKTGGAILADNAGWNDISAYSSLPASFHNLDITDANNNTLILRSYDADLTPYAGQGMVIFSSGFEDPSLNQNGADFGLFGALPDGTVIQFQDVTGVHQNQAQQSLISISPNPAAEYAILHLNGTISDQQSIRIINATGQTVEIFQPASGSNSVMISTRGLNKGFYFIEWMNGSAVSTSKLLVY